MFKKTSFLIFTVVCGISSIIHSDIVSAGSLETKENKRLEAKHLENNKSEKSAHPKYKLHSRNKAHKIKARHIIPQAEHSVESSGGCQGQCTKSENF